MKTEERKELIKKGNPNINNVSLCRFPPEWALENLQNKLRVPLYAIDQRKIENIIDEIKKLKQIN